MTEQDWKRLALGLGVVAVVLGGVVGSLLIAGSPSPTPSASPGIAQASGSPGPSSSSSTLASPSAGASASASPSAAASPSASPKPSPSPTPKVPKTVVRIANLQVDDPAATDATPRTFVVTTDGPGTMTARLVTAKGGKVRFCLQAGNAKKSCGSYNSGVTLTGLTSAKGQTRFTVTASGATAGISPTATIDVTFFATAPKLEFMGLRIDPARGPAGLDARLTTRVTGSLELLATLTDAGSTNLATDAPWRFRLTALSGSTVPPQDAADIGATVQQSIDVPAKSALQVRLGVQQGTNPALLAAGALTWP